jgi:hypothetical protein
MATQKSKKGSDQVEALNINVNRKGINYATLEKQIANVLRVLYDDYNKNGSIYGISRYEFEVPRTYLRKIADIEIIKRITASKKNMQYKWNSGDNPNFDELAHKVIISSSPRPEKNKPVKNYSYDASRISMLLVKKGIDMEKIPEITREIMQILNPDSD